MCPFGMPFLLISRLVGLDFSLLSPVSLIIVQRVLVRHKLIAYLGSLDLVAIKLYEYLKFLINDYQSITFYYTFTSKISFHDFQTWVKYNL